MGFGNCAEHAIQRDGLVLGVAVLPQLDINRQQIVDAADLDAMACIVDKRPIGLVGLVAEASQRLEHGGVFGILQERNLEALAAERLRHQGRVVLGIGQRAHPGIS
jgi:hypothetical protein